MITIAGGILLAIFILAVLFGFVLMLRNVFRFIAANAWVVGAVALIGALWLGVALLVDAHDKAAAMAAKCTGQCEYR